MNLLNITTKRAFIPMAMLPVILLAFALRLHHIGAKSLWYDELLELDIAQGTVSNILPQLMRHAAMPLDYFLLHGWIMLGRQETWVRLPALFFGILAVPLIYKLGRHLFNRRVGYLAALLLTFSSFAVAYGQEARPYALLLFSVTVAYLGLWRAYQTNQNRYWGLFMVGLVTAVLSHYFALFMLAPMGLFVAGRQFRSNQWRHTAFFGLSIIVLFFVVLLVGRVPVLYSVGQRFITESYQLEKYTRPPAEKLNRGSGPPVETSFLVEKVMAPLGAAAPAALLFYTLFLLMAAPAMVQSQKRAAVLLLLGWLVLPILLIYTFLLYRGTFYAVRYILFTLPAYLLLVACGIDTCIKFISRVVLGVGRSHANRQYAQTAWRVGLTLLAVTPLLLAEFNQLATHYTSPPYEDWRAVAHILQNHAAPDDVVIAVKAEPAVNWYYSPAAAPFGTYNRSQSIWEAMRNHKQRWFVLNAYSRKVDEGLRAWLKRQGAVTIVIDRRIVLYYHIEGKSKAAMLAEVKQFPLPENAGTYRILADQFKAQGDLESSAAFYDKAVALEQASSSAATPPQTLTTMIAALLGQ